MCERVCVPTCPQGCKDGWCIHVCMYGVMYVHAVMCMLRYVCICRCVYLYACRHAYVHVCVPACMCKHLCACMYICICPCVQMCWACMCTHMHVTLSCMKSSAAGWCQRSRCLLIWASPSAVGAVLAPPCPWSQQEQVDDSPLGDPPPQPLSLRGCLICVPSSPCSQRSGQVLHAAQAALPCSCHWRPPGFTHFGLLAPQLWLRWLRRAPSSLGTQGPFTGSGVLGCIWVQPSPLAPAVTRLPPPLATTSFSQ